MIVEILYIDCGMLSIGVPVRESNCESIDIVVVVGVLVCVAALFIMLCCCIINECMYNE